MRPPGEQAHVGDGRHHDRSRMPAEGGDDAVVVGPSLGDGEDPQAGGGQGHDAQTGDGQPQVGTRDSGQAEPEAGDGQHGQRDDDRGQEPAAPLQAASLGVLREHHRGQEAGRDRQHQSEAGCGGPVVIRAPAQEQHAQQAQGPGREQTGDGVVGEQDHPGRRPLRQPPPR